ncbi:twin-arginine translocase subunit TatC [Halobaculum magnesiiphilum]|uniref:Sec-independent protein translocase protein TatC n=2 Tax=Halobaculum magnesiiphilum TaxID=1017351 RepID=A0A8T8W916_9EURY|nr:twin-arginine translocase subunit TatC [Halobaculum magnesiiphilum]QZP36352.1 twin-arginine translocase subunit TatC [Halobaculum magnesiiphilum]
MSSALDEDTRRSLADGRATAGAMLRSAQKDLQKVFLVFLAGFMGTFYALRLYVWDFLKSVTRAQLSETAGQEVEIIAQTPFDVILLQAKIGLIVGIIVGIPPLLYFSRDALRERGAWPQAPVARWKLVVIFVLAVALFAGGVAYGYLVFFPFMFAFLANNALSAGILPTYSIVKWAQFIALLTFSFGFAAQMPLAITGLSYAEIVPYETFREKWRHATVGIFVFGAVFSPPDPFTQVMWAAPLLLLYGASLYLAKIVVTARRGSERIDATATARLHWNVLAGIGVAVAAAMYLFFARGGAAAVNDVVAGTGLTNYRFATDLPVPALAALAGGLGIAAAVVALAYYVYAELDETTAVVGDAGDPDAIDLLTLDEAGVRAAPPEAFEGMTEPEALEAASTAMEADEPGKAQAILDRFDEAVAAGAAGAAEEDAGDGDAPARSGPPRDLFAGDVGVVGSIRRGSGLVDWRGRFGSLWNVLLGIAGVVAAVGYVLVERPTLADSVLVEYGTSAGAILAALGVSGTAALVAFVAAGIALALLLAGLLGLYFAYAAGTDPDAVDIEVLTVDEVRRAPDAVFAGLSERRVNYLADRAAAAGDSAKARAVLDRFDELQAAREAAESSSGADAAGGSGGGGPSIPGLSDDAGDRASRATGTLLEGVTDGERDEDDIGGYYDDLAFIAASLRSRLFVLVSVFGVTLASVFAFLYLGGIGDVKNNFVNRIPEEIVGVGAENFGVIVLHPVEALIFEVKISTIAGAVAVLPFMAYYAWPALRDRGFVRGRRQVVFGWVAALLAGLLGGLALGYTVIAPAVISWLVSDALAAGMVISYRISDFAWLVFFTTVGIGFLADVPVLMVLLNTTGVSYQAMRSRWREVTVGIMLVAALFTPADVFTMFLVTIPLMAAYGVGLLILWVMTLGGRRNLAEPTVDLTR